MGPSSESRKVFLPFEQNNGSIDCIFKKLTNSINLDSMKKRCVFGFQQHSCCFCILRQAILVFSGNLTPRAFLNCEWAVFLILEF